MLLSEITKSRLYRQQRSQRTWKVTIASLRKVAAVFGADMSKNPDLNSTETFILAAVIIRHQVACEQIQ